MRRFLVVAIVIGAFAVPAGAAECQSVTFEGGYIASRSGNESTVRTALVGNFLQVQVGEYTGQMPEEGTVSHDIGNSIGATICPDGSVSFTQAEVVELPTPEAPVVVEEDVILSPFEAEFSLLPS